MFGAYSSFGVSGAVTDPGGSQGRDLVQVRLPDHELVPVRKSGLNFSFNPIRT